MNSRIVVVAGPNGCGKTTFVQEYLEEHPFPYISADAIAEGMDTGSIENVRLEAGREFIKQVTTQIEKRESFVVETTLSGLMFTRILREAREVGYDISILFIFLGSADACLARIRERVRKGGHSVPEEDILRRFPRSIKNFWTKYKTFADRWHIFHNGGSQFHEVALGEGDSIEIRDEGLFEVFLGVVEKKE